MSMSEPLPQMPITPEHLAYVLAAMLVYQQYLHRQTPPTPERAHTLSVLSLLLPKLQRGIEPHEGELPLWLTVDEVAVMKGGFTLMIDKLKRKPASQPMTREIERLKRLKTLFNQYFPITDNAC
jgi:hypothetical protein